MSNVFTHKRIYGLDIMRAAAIGFVMLSHGLEYSDRLIPFKYYGWLAFDGVGLFFVLSGFLIGGILIRTIEERSFTLKELRSFWLRRWFRTLPNFYLVLCILAIAYYVRHSELPPQLLQYVTFTQNFARPHPLFFGEAWSLPVEEWFYLLIPFGLCVTLYAFANKRLAVLGWALLILAAVTGIRIYKVSHHDYFTGDDAFGLEIAKQVITRLDSIMYGLLGAWLSRYYPLMWSKHKNSLFVAGVLLLVACNFFHSPFFLGYLYFSLAALGALCLLPKLSSLSGGSGWLFRIITFISVVSYSMYLTNHMIVQRAVLPKLWQALHLPAIESRAGSVIALFLFWGLTLLFSYLLYRFWEKPVMKLRDRFTR